MTRHVLKLMWNRKRANLLLMTEIFFAFIVLFAVVALGVYTADNWRRPTGMRSEGVWVVGVDMKRVGNDSFAESQVDRVQRLMAVLRDMPEVEMVAGSELSPYEVGSSSRAHEWRGRRIEYGVSEVTDDFKDLLGLEVVEGRWFGPEDNGASYEPVVINKAMRDELFAGESAVGQNLAGDRDPRGARPREVRVVGVVAAFREDGEIDGQAAQAIARKDFSAAGDGRPDTRVSRPPGNLLIRVRPGTTAAFEEPLLKQLQAVAPDWSFDVEPLAAKRASMLRFALTPLIAVALVAGFLLLMVAMGLTGVLWQTVTQRTREMGLRRAKGASRSDVRKQILAELLLMTSLALAVGTVLVVQLPLLEAIPWVEPHVYLVGLMISLAAMYALTLASGWYPSLMATRIEPADALRYE